MNVKPSPLLPGPGFLAWARACLVLFLVAWLSVAPVHGAFHLWNIREVYTDASGTNQFIEFFTASSSQQFVGGRAISITDGVTTRTFTIPSNLPGDSASHAFLIGTASIDDFGSPVPDFVIPNNFLFPNGGTITFFGANSGPYTALPTDGSLSRTWGGGNAVNSPQNFLGQFGTIAFPNIPPMVEITNPPNNKLFGAPATFPVGVSATDSDGTVATVQLLTNGVVAATVTAPPFEFTLAGLAAGKYVLHARAEDNGSTSRTSPPVDIRVVDLPVLVASPGTLGPLRFHFNTVVGIDYVVERGTPLTNFSSVVTNPGTGGVFEFDEPGGGAVQRTYRLRLE